jgi:hypothetical protein
VISEPLVAPTAHADASHHGWREGVRAGLLAAAVGALWSLLVDVVAGHPMSTWYSLGYALLSLVGPSGAQPPALAAVVFLAFITLVFVGLGRVAIAVAHRADRQPSLILFANTIVTLVTLALFVTATAYETSAHRGLDAWLQMLGSPLIALWTLAIRVYRTHPSLADDVARLSDS